MIHSNIDLSFCWGFPEAVPEEGLPRLRRDGFEGIELWPDSFHKFGAKRWATALRDTGMRCFQLCPYFDFVSGRKQIERSQEMLRNWAGYARELNCKRLRVFTGPPWGAGVVNAREATDWQWESAIAHLQEFCDSEPELEFCLECHEGSLMEDSPSTLRLLQGVNRRNLTTNLQLPLQDEEWQVSLDHLAPFTTHIHIHNWTEALGVGDLTYLAEGTFDWSPVVCGLIRQGRSLCLSVEHVDHHGRHDPWETARRDGAWLQTFRKNIFEASEIEKSLDASNLQKI